MMLIQRVNAKVPHVSRANPLAQLRRDGGPRLRLLGLLRDRGRHDARAPPPPQAPQACVACDDRPSEYMVEHGLDCATWDYLPAPRDGQPLQPQQILPPHVLGTGQASHLLPRHHGGTATLR